MVSSIFSFPCFGADKIRYFSAIAKPNVNIEFYGNNNDFLSENPIEFNLDSWFFLQRINVRVAKSNLFLGGVYIFFKGKTTFTPFPDNPIFNELWGKLNGTTTISMLKPMVNCDSRNNIFTPTKGLDSGIQFSYNAKWLGAEENYYIISPYFLGHKNITENILSGFRFDSNFMTGDAPFYAKPFVDLHGVPAMKYLSNNTMLIESEWKFKVYKRWSVDFLEEQERLLSLLMNLDLPLWYTIMV